MKKPRIASLAYLLAGVLIGVGLSHLHRFVRVVYAHQEHRANQVRQELVQRSPAAISCETIVQTYADVGVVAYLSADAPLGTTSPSAVFQVKGPHKTDPWQPCTTAGICNGAALPDVTHPGADPADGTPRYAANVNAVTAQAFGPQGAFDFASPRWIRLVTQYSMSGPACVSQATFEVNANADYPIFLFVPQGKSITRLMTFGRELLPGKNWIPCDNVVNPPNGLWIGAGCSGLILNFGYKPLSPDDSPDPSDGATGLYIGCVSKAQNGIVSSSSRLGCRISVTYQ
jgi:hypothetical protein